MSFGVCGLGSIGFRVHTVSRIPHRLQDLGKSREVPYGLGFRVQATPHRIWGLFRASLPPNEMPICMFLEDDRTRYYDGLLSWSYLLAELGYFGLSATLTAEPPKPYTPRTLNPKPA